MTLFGYSFIVHLNYLHLKSLKEQKLEKIFLQLEK